MTATSEDGFLGGRLRVTQPVRGFRAGLDAVLLAAAVPAQAGETVLELGAGVGTASLCLAARVTDCAITGVELDPVLCELATANAAANALDARITFVEADVFALPVALRRGFDHVFSNPPFHRDSGQSSPDGARMQALEDKGGLKDWLAAGLKRTKDGGSFTTILRADRLDEALAVLGGAGVSIFPLWPKAGEEAKRIILRTRKGSRAPLRLLAGLVLHCEDGTYTPEAEAILRDAASLALDSARL